MAMVARIAQRELRLRGPTKMNVPTKISHAEGHGECDLSESLPAEPVGVAAQLTKVG